MHRLMRGTALTAVMVLLSCGDTGVDPTAPDEGDEPVVEPEPDPEPMTGAFCEELGYPCTIDEVDPAVGERSQSLLGEARRLIEEGGSNEAAAAWLSDQEGMADVTAQETLVVFRLEGGQPTWLLTPADDTPPPAYADPPGPFGDDVVGHGTQRERMDKRKSAIVLAPFFHQFRSYDVGPTIEGMLNAHAEYRGNVQLEANASLPPLPAEDTATTGDVRVEHFQGWGDKDVIVVSSHGSVLTALGDWWECFLTCIQGIYTGERVRNCDAAIRTKYDGVPGVRCGEVDEVEGTYIVLDSDFFRWEYRLAFALRKSIVYFGACKTSYLGSFALQLSSATNEFFGWDSDVRTEHELGVATRLFDLMINGGLTTKEAHERLEAEGLASQPSADLDLSSNDGGLHIREITTLKNPMHPAVSSQGQVLAVQAELGLVAEGAHSGSLAVNTAPSVGDLENGAILPFLGQAGDGQNDEIFFYVDVDGVQSGRESEFDVRIEVDERELGTWSLDDKRARRIGEFTVRLLVRQLLDFDVTDGLTMTLVATAELPGNDDEESEDRASVIFRNPALHFQSTIETTGGDITAVSEVEAVVPLTFQAGERPKDLRVGASIGPLKYRRFEIEMATATGCTLTSQTTDGRLRIVEGQVPFDDPTSSDWGVPEELLVFPPPEIKETLTIECQGVSQTLPFVHWFAGFASFHGGALGGADETDEERGGFVITGWTPGGELAADGVYSRKVYDRTGKEDEVTFTEHTVMELRGPAYRPQ